ncbi:MAG: hypothetical protein IKZ87_03435 [Actinomycetaceae bacterium]|nr:hypothetical protein [Actinomycetaceae bacterium]
MAGKLNLPHEDDDRTGEEFATNAHTSYTKAQGARKVGADDMEDTHEL